MKDGSPTCTCWTDGSGTIYASVEFVNETGASEYAYWQSATSGSDSGTTGAASIFASALAVLSDSIPVAIMLTVIGIA